MIAIASAISTQTTAQTATKTHPSGNGLIPGKRLDWPRSFPARRRHAKYLSEMSRNRLIEAVGSADVEAPAASPCPRPGRVCLACGCNLEPTRAESGGAVGTGGDLLLPLVRDPEERRALPALAARRGAAADGRRVELLPGARGVLVRRCARRRRADGRDRGRRNRCRDHVLVGARLARGSTAAAAARRRSASRVVGRCAHRAVPGPHGRLDRGRHRLPARARNLGRLHLGIRPAPRRRVGRDELAAGGCPRLREHEPGRPGGGGPLRRALHLRRSALRRRPLPAPLPARRGACTFSARRPSVPVTTPGARRPT